ncbi:17946_t:CDS:2, partial [Gigaspora rosea]
PILSFGEIEDKIGESSTQYIIEMWTLQVMNGPILNFEEGANEFNKTSIQHIVDTWALQA